MYGDDDHLPYITYGIFGITILYLYINHINQKSHISAENPVSRQIQRMRRRSLRAVGWRPTSEAWDNLLSPHLPEIWLGS